VNWDSDTRSIEIIHLPTATGNQATATSSNANHNPLTGGTPITALARDDEDEE